MMSGSTATAPRIASGSWRCRKWSNGAKPQCWNQTNWKNSRWSSEEACPCVSLVAMSARYAKDMPTRTLCWTRDGLHLTPEEAMLVIVFGPPEPRKSERESSNDDERCRRKSYQAEAQIGRAGVVHGGEPDAHPEYRHDCRCVWI